MVNLSSPGAARGRGSRRRIAFAASLCLAVTTIPVGLAATAHAAKPSPEPAKSSAMSTYDGTSFPLSSRTMAPPDPCDPWDPECVNEPADCWVTLGKTISRGDNPEFGGTFSRIDFSGHISCYGTGYVYIQGAARLVDRTPGYSGNTIAAAPSIYQPVEYGRPAQSSRVIDLYDVSWPAGQQAEVRFEFSAQQEFGVWSGCGPNMGSVRFERCDGAGTSTLYVEVVTDVFSTELRPPPRTFGGQASSCSPNIQKSISRDNANRTSTVGFFAQVNCDRVAPQIQMVMDLYDRTPGQGDQPLTTRKSGSGTGSVTLGSEPVVLSDRNHPKGSQAEVVIEAILRTTDGSKWTQCLSLPAGLQYKRPCEGLNTDTLKVYVGTGSFSTQLDTSCFQKQDSWASMVLDMRDNILAFPHMTIQWCYNADGNNVSASFTDPPQPRTTTPALTGIIQNDFGIQPITFEGKAAHRITFSILYEFQFNYTVGIPPATFTYMQGQKCQVSVNVVVTGPRLIDFSTNPCRPWTA